MNWYNNKITLAVVLLVVLVLGGIIVSKTRNGDDAGRQVAESQFQPGPVEVRGTIECLPYVRGGDDQECVNGLLGEDGNFYALNSPREVGRNLGRGNEVLVKGTYQPADNESEESGVFRYEGVIVVTSIERQ